MDGTVEVSRSSTPPLYNTSALAFDQHFFKSARGRFLLAEVVFGFLVWILIGGTNYFSVTALYWVMFVSIFYWILTVCLFIIYLTGVSNRMPQIPWTTLSLCFDCSAAVLHLVTAVIVILTVKQAIRGRHNYNCWAASAFFAVMTTTCYAGSSYMSYSIWRSAEEEL